MNLTKKEQRLFDYYAECEQKGIRPTIGDICRDCHTTVFTLLTKTSPNLNKKMREYISDIEKTIAQ